MEQMQAETTRERTRASELEKKLASAGGGNTATATTVSSTTTTLTAGTGGAVSEEVMQQKIIEQRRELVEKFKVLHEKALENERSQRKQVSPPRSASLFVAFSRSPVRSISADEEW